MMEVSSVEVSSAFTFVSRTAFSCCCPQQDETEIFAFSWLFAASSRCLWILVANKKEKSIFSNAGALRCVPSSASVL